MKHHARGKTKLSIFSIENKITISLPHEGAIKENHCQNVGQKHFESGSEKY